MSKNLKRKKNLHFRSATLNDIPQLLELESYVWGEQACTYDMLASRIQAFSKGQIIGLTEENKIVGYIGLQFIRDLSDSDKNWAEVTDNGTIENTHDIHAEYMFGISLTGHPEYKGVGVELQLQAWALIIQHRKKGCFLGSRIPTFYKFKEKYSIEQYVFGKDGKSFDPEVRYYQEANFRIVKIISNYFPDPENCNYGVLMYCPNIFKYFPGAKFWATLVRKYGFTFLDLMGY